MLFSPSSSFRRWNPPATAIGMACFLASVGCGAESPFAPDFRVEETPRLSLSEEPPSVEERPAAATDVPSSRGGESGESSVEAADDQPKLVPGISRVSIAPLVVIDGVVQPDHFRLSDIQHLDIDHVEVVKGAAALQLYGPRAKGGAIEIQTKRGRQATLLNGLKPR